MRAVTVYRFGGFEDAALVEVAAPVPAPGELTISVAAAAVNHIDLVTIAGDGPVRPPLPFIPGSSAAGTITALGDGVTGFRVGERVLALVETGGYAEQVVAAQNRTFRLPAAMPLVDAAAMAVAYETAWFALLDQGQYEAGQTVLVLGASGAVGQAAVQLAKALGATVLAGIARPDRAALARHAGADAIVDLARPGLRESLRDSLRQQVMTLTAGRGADIILDPLGGEFCDAAVRALAWRGRLVTIGFAAGPGRAVDARILIRDNTSVSGLRAGEYRIRAPGEVSVCFAELFAMYEAGQIAPMRVTPYPLEGFAEALRLLRDRKTTGKPILRPQRDPEQATPRWIAPV
ncbi:MAG: NADPH:quinone oxidoreductase family protein [Alphaproteobacteria bacterium]|nr:NADPH:quinone oxidoreductase family protein [Alphaproteobacteria bacterium]